MSVREAPKVVSLATALAALAVPAGAKPIIDEPADAGPAGIASPDTDAIRAEAEVRFLGDAELMAFTVHQSSEGMMFPQHSSHSSHSSHASHASHASSSPGFGLPDAPSPYIPNPYVPTPYVPPVYVPPAAVAPAVLPPASPTPTTEPAPAQGVDVAYIACTRARNGYGVNDISAELQGYGLSVGEATNIATQALTAVLGGGHFCDAYHGD